MGLAVAASSPTRFLGLGRLGALSSSIVFPFWLPGSEALLFLSPSGACGHAVSVPHVFLSLAPVALVVWPGL